MNKSLNLKNAAFKLIILMGWALLFIAILYVPKAWQQLKSDRSLNIATWTDMIDEEIIKQFEHETDIKVNISYFDNNDELLIKMRTTEGEGYDLIIPSDHTIELLKNDGLLKKFDKSKITVWDRINKRLLGAYFDPTNDYSIPYYWGIYGLGIDKDFFKNELPASSWDLIFKPLNPPAKISMLDNPREAVLLTAYALFGAVDSLTHQQQEEIKKTLIEQKKWVEAYTEFRADYLLLSKACPIVVTTTPAMFRLMKVVNNIEFVVPREGSFMVTDNWAIPAASTKQEYAYAFINFLFKPEVIAHHFRVFTFIPATIDIEQLLAQYPSILAAHSNQSTPLYYFRNSISKDMLNDVWISLKA